MPTPGALQLKKHLAQDRQPGTTCFLTSSLKTKAVSVAVDDRIVSYCEHFASVLSFHKSVFHPQFPKLQLVPRFSPSQPQTC